MSTLEHVIHERRSGSSFVWVEGKTPHPFDGVRLGPTVASLPPVANAQLQMQRFQGIALQQVLEQPFLTQLQKLCDTGNFISDSAEPGHREVESPQRCGRALNLAFSRPAFLRWLEETTRCGSLGEVAGRVVQTLPRPGDELRWHDDRPGGDARDDRRLAIVLNLGEHTFEGGEFELRRKSGDLLLQHKHTAANSLLIFRVSAELEHRVLPLSSGGPRRVYTAWAMALGTQ